MKQSSRIFGLAAVALSVFVGASAVDAAIGKAVVRAVRGKADVSQGSGWVVLKTGMALRPGATVRTGVDSSVDLYLDQNGPFVRITEQTEIGLDKLNFEQTGGDIVIETALDLKSGRVLGSVHPMVAASRYEVKTPQGVAGIKGTDYDITAAGVIKIVQGQAVFAYRDSSGTIRTVTVNTGEVFNPIVGRVTPIPASELPGLLREFEDIKRILPTDIVIIIPPNEPFVSAIVGSSSGGPRERHSESSGD